MKLDKLILPAALCLSLSGCVVAAAADLAATTVFTAGKLAVKGTGALIGAAIPDDDDKDKKKKTHKNEPQSTQLSSQAHPTNNLGSSPDYGTHANSSPSSFSSTTEPPHYITISPDAQIYRDTSERTADEDAIE